MSDIDVISIVLSSIGVILTIFSIFYTIYLNAKNDITTQEKARREVVRTLSYRIVDNVGILENNIRAVYNSKLREYRIRTPLFNEDDVLDDLKSDIISNPFLDSGAKDMVLSTLSGLPFGGKNYMDRKVPLLKKIIDNLTVSFFFGLFLLITVITVFISLLPYYSHMLQFRIWSMEQEMQEMHISINYDEYNRLKYMHIFITNTPGIVCILILLVLLYCFLYYIIKKFSKNKNNIERFRDKVSFHHNDKN